MKQIIRYDIVNGQRITLYDKPFNDMEATYYLEVGGRIKKEYKTLRRAIEGYNKEREVLKGEGLYFGTFSAYEDYYAVGSTKEEVKKMLWKMYSRNFYGKPTKEDRKSFEEEVYIREIKADCFGYNTMNKECYIAKGNRLERAKGE